MEIKTMKMTGFKYNFFSDRKGAKYEWKCGRTTYKGNSGEFFEAAIKYTHGYKPIKDASTPYDEGSDIEEENTSVKSWDFTLANKCKDNSFEKVLIQFFRNVHSSRFIFGWVDIDANEVVEINMNTNEFHEFLNRYARYDANRKVVRGCAFSQKKRMDILIWVEKNC